MCVGGEADLRRKEPAMRAAHAPAARERHAATRAGWSLSRYNFLRARSDAEAVPTWRGVHRSMRKTRNGGLDLTFYVDDDLHRIERTEVLLQIRRGHVELWALTPVGAAKKR